MSRLIDLAKEVQGMGFYYYTSERGYRHVAGKGFKVQNPNGIWGSVFPEVLDHLFIDPSTKFNEALSWRTKTTEKRGWFSSKEVPMESELILENGTSEPGTLELVYGWRRIEPDHAKRPAHVVQGLVAPASLVEQIIEVARVEPQNLGIVFQGVFPELDKKYHADPNGRILIVSEEQIVSGDIARNVYEYNVNK